MIPTRRRAQQKSEQVPASISAAFGKGSVAFSDAMAYSNRDKGEMTIIFRFHRTSDLIILITVGSH